MTFVPIAGASVQTKFGPGRVVRSTRTGAMVSLDRMSNLQVEISVEELTRLNSVGRAASVPTSQSPAELVRGEMPEPVGSPRVQKSTEAVSIAEAIPRVKRETDTPLPSAGRPRDISSDAALDARCSIEALRFGIVPQRSIEQVTIGYVALEKWTCQSLLSGKETRATIAEVCGPFGTGKSHTMAAVRHIAQKHGYVTATVEVDGRSISISDPASVLRQLWKSVRANDLASPTPLLELNVRAIQQGRDKSLAALESFDRVRLNLQTIDTLVRAGCLDSHAESMEGLLACGDEILSSALRVEIADDLSARGIYWSDTDNIADPRGLIGHLVDQRANDFVDCLIGYSVLAREAGYTGLAITIDEFEVEYQLSHEKIERLKNVILALRNAFRRRSKDVTGPLAIFIATVGSEGHVGDQIVDTLIDASGGLRHPLSPWPFDRHTDLARRIYALYRQAYAIQKEFDAELANDVQLRLRHAAGEESGLIRAFIKEYVAALDATYGPQARAIA